jgi:para-aminobenzoate synthetase component 1
VESPRDIQAETPFHVYHPKRNIEKTEYLKKIDIIKGYIDKGDVYQVNFSYRHHVEFSGPLSELYRRLRHNAPAPFSAYLSVGDVTVLSTSPERFFKLDGRHVVTSPIKGTRPRFGDNRDPGLQEDLLQSEKDNAELLMIVDLERNDLNTICKTGTVHVSCLKRLEQFQHVIHLVADVEGELLDDVTQVQVLQALFPGGSITGAPKIRAMEIISELETLPRALYTGCLGYFSFSGPSEFNIAIRSLYAKDQKMYFHTGGGIVADSDGDLEWEESRAKAKGILLALGIKEGI